MKRFILILVLIHFGQSNVFAQKELSKKEIRKNKKIRKLEASINLPEIEFIANTMSSSLGQNRIAHGLLFIRGSKGELLEFLLLDQNKLKPVSTEFKIENFNANGSFKENQITINFSGNIKNDIWRFKVNVDRSGKATMQLNNDKGTIIWYYGRIIRL